VVDFEVEVALVSIVDNVVLKVVVVVLAVSKVVIVVYSVIVL
tara:strand:+ start:115 stop:240 length:126 start_codon:yes stop_codon:yes gene_type:complete